MPIKDDGVVEYDAIDTTWRYGTYRANVQPDGMR